jgi:hypothetical protein
MHCTSPIEAVDALVPAAAAVGGCGDSYTLPATCALVAVHKCSIAVILNVPQALLLRNCCCLVDAVAAATVTGVCCCIPATSTAPAAAAVGTSR